MIFKGIIKNWKFILDILIVLGIILFVFLWNPFNLFGKGLKLQDTSNMVSEIKEIGELVTAEYYGEVIASHEEAELDIIGIDSIEILGESHYYLIKKAIHESYQATEKDVEEDFENRSNRKRQKERNKAMRKLRSNIGKEVDEVFKRYLKDKSISEDIYNSVILFVGKYEHGSKIKTKKFVRKNDKDRDNWVKRILGQVLEYEFDRIEKYEAGDLAFDDYVSAGFKTHMRYTDFFYEYKGLSKKRKERNAELAVIGRGSVKAGFKFDQLNEENVIYDKGQQTIYFFGFNAEILTEDINPWFIPERKVPGFQIIAEKDGTFDKMKELKIHCVKKLRHNAEIAGILEQAQANGEEALKEFFSLLTGDEIKKVVFRKETLAYQTEEILRDSVISFNESILIDSIINRAIADLDTSVTAIQQRKKELLVAFISKLKTAELVHTRADMTEQYPYNQFTRLIPRLLLDTIISQQEYDFIAKDTRHNPVGVVGDSLLFVRLPAELNYWFSDSLDYLSEFNTFIEHLENSSFYSGCFSIDSLNGPINTLSSDPKKQDRELTQINAYLEQTDAYHEIIGDKVYYFKLYSMSINLSDLKYPVLGDIDFQKSYVQPKSVAWYQNSDLDSLPGYTILNGTMDSLVSTNTLDSDLFQYPVETESYSISIGQDSAMVIKGVDTIKVPSKFLFGKPLHLTTNLDSTNFEKRWNQEVWVIRNHLVNQNKSYNNIGPVMKLRRSFDNLFQSNSTLIGVRENVKDWAIDLQGKFGD